MAWSTHPTIVTGQAWTATDQNTYVKGNLDTLFPYNGTNQVAYSTSSTSLTKATASAAMQVLRSNSTNSALEFSIYPVVYKRQGSSTQWWTSTGSTVTTNYTPATSYIQVGSVEIGGLTRVTFPVAFSIPPIVFVYNMTETTPTGFTYVTGNPDETGFSVTIDSYGGWSPASIIQWLAVGEI